MDRVSGVLPPIGWSPLLMPSLPKAAPATTVEAASASASANSGQGANVGTQSGQAGTGTAATAAQKPQGAEAATSAAATAGYGDSEILSLPAGPSPAFRISLLEQQAARVRAGGPETEEKAEPEAEQKTDDVNAAQDSANAQAAASQKAEPVAPAQAAAKLEVSREVVANEAPAEAEASLDVTR